MQLQFHQLDVFTDRALGGNPLAVFPQASGLSGELMLALARETNLSETTFIERRDEETHTYKVRIFCPAQEMPFAGHPTIGTAWHIFRELADDVREITLELPAGLVKVRREPGGLVYFEPPRATLGPVIEDRAALARLVSLSDDDLALGIAPAQQVVVGLAYCKIPLKSRAALDRAECDLPTLRSLGEQYGFNQVTVFCLEPYRDGSLLATRMFAPLHGVAEDPATGSSAASLTLYLRHHNVIGDTGEEWLRYDQGYSLSRPSLICARANMLGGEIIVNIGGHTVEIARGTYNIPD